MSCHVHRHHDLHMYVCISCVWYTHVVHTCGTHVPSFLYPTAAGVLKLLIVFPFVFVWC